MSVPHTGQLVAVVNGLRCEFDGNRWKTPEGALTEQLNAATDAAVKTHVGIHELAERVLTDAGLEQFEIVSWKNDVWPDELPPDAID